MEHTLTKFQKNNYYYNNDNFNDKKENNINKKDDIKIEIEITNNLINYKKITMNNYENIEK